MKINCGGDVFVIIGDNMWGCGYPWVTMIGWIILGLLAGLIAKFIMPGDDPGGLIMTILIGIAGAFAGGWLAGYLTFLPASEPGALMPSVGSLATAVIGAVLLLAVYRKIFG